METPSFSASRHFTFANSESSPGSPESRASCLLDSEKKMTGRFKTTQVPMPLINLKAVLRGSPVRQNPQKELGWGQINQRKEARLVQREHQRGNERESRWEESEFKLNLPAERRRFYRNLTPYTFGILEEREKSRSPLRPKPKEEDFFASPCFEEKTKDSRTDTREKTASSKNAEGNSKGRESIGRNSFISTKSFDVSSFKEESLKREGRSHLASVLLESSVASLDQEDKPVMIDSETFRELKKESNGSGVSEGEDFGRYHVEKKRNSHFEGTNATESEQATRITDEEPRVNNTRRNLMGSFENSVSEARKRNDSEQSSLGMIWKMIEETDQICRRNKRTIDSLSRELEIQNEKLQKIKNK